MLIGRRHLLAGLAAGWALPAWAQRRGPGPAAYPDPAQEWRVPVPGGRLYVRSNGPLTGARPPLVLIHGGPGGTHDYLLDALALSDQRAVILYDQLGTGRSDWPDDRRTWTVPAFTDELDEIRKALGIARWHVLGHSWGGTVALEYGARRPEALAGLILASPLISTRSWIADADTLRRELPATTQADLASCDVAPEPAQRCAAGTRAFYAAFNGREPAPEAERRYARGGRGGNGAMYRGMWGSSEFVAAGTLKDYDGEPLLARLDGLRTLFLGGQYDEARAATLAGFAARVPGAELATVPGAAHNIFGDRPAETIGILRGWLERHDA
ncbi:proline iminopeptidase/L-proline amide hydrolase [Sphingomonas gellani]|uniref:Proline iminopeptidase/L-proline amide hydrolase n=1 Tax=Sphingomonas gellani TaxID=1166340 RepID=A0A1H8DFJ8_9SPHN|nr:proline iminopeptidase-family hydrolase [Sphingomonas gellani]SEN06071.1 proline iminopeptidase/L-proline amide hydrolase [Sphingomonas gellani]